MSVNVIDDGHGNLVVKLTASDDGYQNITISGAVAIDDGNGNLVIAAPQRGSASPVLYGADYDVYSILDVNRNTATDINGNSPITRNAEEEIPYHNGIGVLSDAIECYTESELNGGYELMMRYPADGVHAADIVNRNIIMAANEKGGELQPYRIYRVTKSIGGIYNVYARHIVQTDLAGIPVKPFKSTNVASAMQNLNDNAMLDTGFSFYTNKTTFASMNIDKPTPLLSVLGGIDGSILDTYGGEYKYDGKSVALLDRLGADNGVRIAYGVNLTNFEQDANIQDCYTGAVGYWANDEATVYTDVVIADGTFDHVRIATIDLTDKFENKPAKARLESALRSYMSANKIGVPAVSINLSFVDLSQTTEYADIAQSVALGDTVHVSFPKIGVDASARVVKTRWNVLLDRYDNIDIGSVKSNIADTIAKQTRQIADAPTRKTAAAIAVAMAQVIMGAAGGAVRILDKDEDGMPDELYIADNPDPDLAQKVWRFNYEGWAASQNGYDGPYEMSATFDYGIIAKMLSAMFSRTFYAADYSQTDVTRIGAIIRGEVTPTAADIEKYDFDGSGTIGATDLLMCNRIVSTGQNLVAEWTASVEPIGKAFRIHHKRSGAYDSESDTFAAGAFGIQCSKIECTELYVNGHQIT